MALPRVADRVLESTGVTGAGPATLGGAQPGYRSFNAAVGVSVQCYYSIEDAATGDWEIGEGHLSGATTLVRDRVVESSNAGALVAFLPGAKRAFVIDPAEVHLRYAAHDGETPAGAVNGSNATFTLAAAPDPPGSLRLAVNGLLQRPGAGNDFILSGLTVTFQAGAVPMAGDVLEAAYTA
jgi:hypothetical protein